jgi:hypothetical protein
MPGVAARNPPQSKPGSPNCTVTLDRDERVFRTAWSESTICTKQWTDEIAVPANQQHEDRSHCRVPKRPSISARNAPTSKRPMGLRARKILSIGNSCALLVRKTSRMRRLIRFRSTERAINRLPTTIPRRAPRSDAWRKIWKCALTAAGLARNACENSSGVARRCARRNVNRGEVLCFTHLGNDALLPGAHE